MHVGLMVVLVSLCVLFRGTVEGSRKRSAELLIITLLLGCCTWCLNQKIYLVIYLTESESCK